MDAFAVLLQTGAHSKAVLFEVLTILCNIARDDDENADYMQEIVTSDVLDVHEAHLLHYYILLYARQGAAQAFTHRDIGGIRYTRVVCG